MYLNSSITDSSSFGQNKVELEDIFANIKATSLIPKDGKIPILLRILAKVASDKKGVLKVDGGGFISKDDQTISVELNAKDIDLTYLKCIFNERLRNLIGSGIVNINSPVEYNSRNIDSLTRVTLRDFEFNEDESDKFSIKGFSIAALVESFKDKDGVIDFDFRTRGTIGALRYSFGPLSQKKLAGMTINLIRNQIRSIGQKSEEIIKEKSSNTVEKIKLLIDFKDKDEASEEKEAE